MKKPITYQHLFVAVMILFCSFGFSKIVQYGLNKVRNDAISEVREKYSLDFVDNCLGAGRFNISFDGSIMSCTKNDGWHATFIIN